MKKNLLPLLAALCAVNFACAQNMLGANADFIKKYKSGQGAYFEGRKYTTDGNAFLQFDYSTKQSDINDILVEAYYLKGDTVCDSYKIVYKSTKMLDYVVSNIKSHGNFIKVPDKFMWINKEESYRVEINLQKDGFEMVCANGISN